MSKKNILAGWAFVVLAWIVVVSMSDVAGSDWRYIVLLAIMAAFTVYGIIVTARMFRRLRKGK